MNKLLCGGFFCVLWTEEDGSVMCFLGSLYKKATYECCFYGGRGIGNMIYRFMEVKAN